MNNRICFDRIASPLGPLLLAADGPTLSGIWFEGQRYFPQAVAQWERRSDSPVLRRAASQLAEFFAGERTRFDLQLTPSGTPYQRAVWKAIAGVAYGETIAYRDLATRSGRPEAIRAAGAATGRNPWSIVVPCHRIVGADGSLTGYAGGLERKQALLSLERGAAARAAVRRAA